MEEHPVHGGGGAAKAGLWRWSNYERTVEEVEQLQEDGGGGAAMRGRWRWSS